MWMKVSYWIWCCSCYCYFHNMKSTLSFLRRKRGVIPPEFFAASSVFAESMRCWGDSQGIRWSCRMMILVVHWEYDSLSQGLGNGCLLSSPPVRTCVVTLKRQSPVDTATGDWTADLFWPLVLLLYLLLALLSAHKICSPSTIDWCPDFGIWAFDSDSFSTIETDLSNCL